MGNAELPPATGDSGQSRTFRSVRDRARRDVHTRGAMTKAKKLDRRVQRTRQLLQDALLAMVIEKGYDATTVQDIIDRANVGRTTFYAHFPDKQTLLTSRLEDLRALLTERRRQAPGLGFSLAMLEHARDHLPLYAAIVGRGGGSGA